MTLLHDWFHGASRRMAGSHYNAITHERLRLHLLLGMALCKVFNIFGSTWDIQWHVTIGRDSLWIPPHLLALVGFGGQLLLALAAIAYESMLSRSGIRLERVVRIAGIRTFPSFLGVYLACFSTVFFGFVDDLWHRAYGLDVSMWSPPHLMIMASMSVINFSLLVGFVSVGRRLGQSRSWRSLWFWGFILVAGFAFESAGAQVIEAFIVSFRLQGAGLVGLLYPIMMGILYPLSLLLSIQLVGRFWITLPLLASTLLLQYAATAMALLGFAILKPESALADFMREVPDSTIALANQLGQANGLNPIIGFQQAWVMGLSALPLALVCLLHWWPWAHRQPWVAAPLYGVSLVLVSYVWFQLLPGMATYDIRLHHLLLAMGLTGAGSLLTGWLGMGLARLGQRLLPSSI